MPKKINLIFSTILTFISLVFIFISVYKINSNINKFTFTVGKVVSYELLSKTKGYGKFFPIYEYNLNGQIYTATGELMGTRNSNPNSFLNKNRNLYIDPSNPNMALSEWNNASTSIWVLLFISGLFLILSLTLLNKSLNKKNYSLMFFIVFTIIALIFYMLQVNIFLSYNILTNVNNINWLPPARHIINLPGAITLFFIISGLYAITQVIKSIRSDKQ